MSLSSHNLRREDNESNAEAKGTEKAESGIAEEGKDENLKAKGYHYERYKDGKWEQKESYKLTKDGKVRKIILEPSPSTVKPKPLGRIWMNVEGKTSKGVIFEEYTFEERDIILGQGEHCKGVEMAVVTMNVGERCVVEVDSPEYSYRDEKVPRKCPKNNEQMDFPLTFEVQLIDCMSPIKNLISMTPVELFQLVQLFREKGNQRYEKKRYQTATKLYEKAIEIFETVMVNAKSGQTEGDTTSVNAAELDDEKVKCYMNCSACALQFKKYQKAIQYADSALYINPQAPKALLRRALGFKSLHKLDEALQDIETVLAMPNLDPVIVDMANKQLQIVKKEIKNSELETSTSSSEWSRKVVEVLTTAGFGLIDFCLNCCRKKNKSD